MHDRYRDLVAWDPPVFGQLGMRPESLGLPDDDERLWVVIDENVWFRPLFSDMTTGSHCEILRVRRGEVPGCHRHPSPVHGYVIKGSWRYFEYSWVAREGAYVFEPTGQGFVRQCREHFDSVGLGADLVDQMIR